MATPPTFTVGQVLTAAHMNAVGMWLVKTQTVGSGVTSVPITSAFSSDYDNYEIVWSGGTMTSSSGDSQIAVQLGSTTTNYRTTLLYNANSNVAVSAATNLGSSFSWAGGGSTNDAYSHFRLFNPFLTRHTRYESTSYLAWADAAFGFASGVQTSNTSFTGFTLLVTGTGTMTGGTIRVYGYRN
jgi:hypothetical protein